MDAAPDPLDLVRLLKAKYGITPKGRATGDTALARALGWDTANTRQRIRRWEREGKLPSYQETWAMLNALGWIRREPAPIDVIEDYVTSLDAGAKVSARERERVARLADRLETQVHRLAARVRGDDQAEGKAS